MSTKNTVTQTSAALTDNSGGTASSTIVAQTGSYVEATQENTVASLAAEINKLVVDVAAILTALNSSHTRITS